MLVGVLGATGMVGQQYVRLLQNHPWFRLGFLAASERSVGKSMAGMSIYNVQDIAKAKENCDFVFSALDRTTALSLEEAYAAAGLPVISNASAHRKTPDVPLLLPEINASHLELIALQQKNRGWEKGFIVVKPNCSLQSYLTPLFALQHHFPIKRVIVTTLQSLSGAGHRALSSLDMEENMIPFIAGEEEKSESEPLRILGKVEGGIVVPMEGLQISAHCNRVPIFEGHTACVSIEFAKNIPEEREILALWKNFRGVPQELALPMAPLLPIHYREEEDRPQPKLDKDHDKGMAVTVGRLRPCPVFHYRFVGLSHNTVRGAAGGGILNAELLTAKGYLCNETSS